LIAAPINDNIVLGMAMLNNYIAKIGLLSFGIQLIIKYLSIHTICPADNATAGSLGRRRAGQLRFGFVAVSAGHIVYWPILKPIYK
jgi:hypothetical protein